jgi:hypothetical protein
MAPMRWIRQALPEWKELKVEAVDVTCERAIIHVSALSPPQCLSRGYRAVLLPPLHLHRELHHQLHSLANRQIAAESSQGNYRLDESSCRVDDGPSGGLL